MLFDRFLGSMRTASTPTSVSLDLSELVLRLLLTDTVVLKTQRLLEVNELIRAFGVKGLLLLFESGKLRLTCEVMAFALWDKDGVVLDPDDFSFVGVWEGDRKDYLRRAQHSIQTGSGAEKVSEQLSQVIEEAPSAATSQFVLGHLRPHLLAPGELLRRGVTQAAKESGLDLGVTNLEFEIEHLEASRYRIRSNLPSPLEPLARRKILSGGALAIAQMYSRVEEMTRHRALTAAKETDLPMLDAHFQFLEEALNTHQQTGQFRRVISLTGAPEVSGSSRINARRLIDAAGSPECLAFRKWLGSTGQLSDDEVKGQFQSLAARAGLIAGGSSGRIVRFVAATAAGFIPVVGTAAGALLGGLDNFVVDQVLKPGGPAIFLKRIYPSLFD